MKTFKHTDDERRLMGETIVKLKDMEEEMRAVSGINYYYYVYNTPENTPWYVGTTASNNTTSGWYERSGDTASIDWYRRRGD